MGIFKKALFVAVSGLGVNVALTVINILQAGSKYPDGRTMKDILGIDPQKATADDVARLSRADCMQLFYAADVPDFASMKGEFTAKVLPGGVQGKASELFTHHVFPTGGVTLKTHWEGKALLPETPTSGYGYNIFSDRSSGSPKVLRLRKFRTHVGPTTLGKDGRNSLHLVYHDFNTGAVKSMHDEARKINDNLYICGGYMALGGGAINPAPFVLIGPPSEWVGLDK
jgi:hypothetical protein